MTRETEPSAEGEEGGKIPGIIARTEAEEALRASEQRYSSLFAESRDGIVITEREGRIAEANSSFCDLIGYTREELLALDVRQLYADPEDRLRFQEKVERDGFVRDYHVVLCRKDGTPLDCLFTFSVRRSPQGSVLGYQGIVRDITERRQMETQLRSLAARLALAEDRERRRIASDLHDQVAQALAVAQLRIETLRGVDAREEQAGLLDELSDLIEQTDHDVRTLMFDLSPPVLYELGLPAALEWLAEQTQGQHGLRVEVTADEHPQSLGEDVAAMLFRCVQELLSNVVKHAAAGNVRISLRHEDDQIHIEVEDDGRGFDTSQLGSAEHESAFGLFSIRERLGFAGGGLDIESEAERGTRCVLTAPLLPPAAPG